MVGGVGWVCGQFGLDPTLALESLPRSGLSSGRALGLPDAGLGPWPVGVYTALSVLSGEVGIRSKRMVARPPGICGYRMCRAER